MSATLALVAAVMIAAPKDGAKLPYLTQTYLLGAANGGETNLVIQGRNVPVCSSGAWVTMVDLVEGKNVIEVAGTNRTLYVAHKPQPSTNAAPSKTYAKLEYAGDAPTTNRARVVVIDAGHGGKDTGAISPHSLPEKDANLRMARAVRQELAQRGFKVIMTRDADEAVDLYSRPKVGFEHNASAFVSIHHNAPPLDKNPLEFRYHAVYAWNEIGEALAKAINAQMSTALGETLKNNGVIHANYAVTRNPEIPSCLIEVDFITHPQGELDSWSPKRRALVAKAIAAGIEDWFKREEPQ